MGNDYKLDHEEDKGLSCSMCKYSTSRQNNLKRHVIACHQTPDNCPGVIKRCRYFKGYYTHKRCRDPNAKDVKSDGKWQRLKTKYECDLCEYRTKRMSML